MPERYQLEEYMDMYDGKVVLCGANSYEEKYYLNPDFEQLPDDVKNELKIMCVLYVHDVGGILTLVFEEDGELCFEVSTEEFDPMFDEIGSRLKIKQLQREKQDLLQALQLYYKVFFLGEEINSGLASTVQGINNALAFDFALKGALSEGAGSAVFFRRD